MKLIQQKRRLMILVLSCITFTWIQAGINPKTIRLEGPDTNAVQNPGKKLRSYNIVRLSTEKPSIDGRLDDACWQTGNWSGDFTQWIPNEGAKPSLPTEIKLLYDDKNIYVAIRAHDNEPGKIHRWAGQRDEIIGDAMGVNFDSYHDHRTGFEFTVTAYGQKVDLIATNPFEFDFNWNAVWSVKTGMEDSAWVAEMEIPLSQLRYSNAEDQVWGMHVWRWIDRLQEESDWEVQSLTSPGILYLFGEIHGIKGLKKSQRLEIQPSLVEKLSTFQKQPHNPYAKDGRSWSFNPGLDAKIGLTSNFTVDLSVNPDFGQVEADTSIMNLTAFETYYEEKRPLFLEGKNIFSYNIDNTSLFYTRRIGQPPHYIPETDSAEYLKMPQNTAILSAVKLSGKTANGLSVGIVQSLTANIWAEISDTARVLRRVSAEPLTNYMVARIQKDYKQGNTILGGIFTSTNRFIHGNQLAFLNRAGYTGGIDLLHQWKDKEYFIDARIIASQILGDEKAITGLQESSARYYQRPDASHLTLDTTLTQISGTGGKIKIGKGSKGLWRYSTEVSWYSPGLELNDLGFIATTDIIHQVNSLSYFLNKPVSIFRTYSFGLEEDNNWNFGGDYLFSGVNLKARADFKNKWTLMMESGYEGEMLDTRILRGGEAMLMPATSTNSLGFRTDASKKVSFFFNSSLVMRNENSLLLKGFYPGISMRPINSLRLGVNFNYSNNTDMLQYVESVSSGSGQKYVFGKIDQQTFGFTVRIDYSITPELSLQFYGSPFVSKGNYSKFKEIIAPRADVFRNRYGLLTSTLRPDNRIDLDETGDGIADCTIDNPDFNFHQFRSNLVLRWEYRPGSMLYFVWASDRTGSGDPQSLSLGESMQQLGKNHPVNIFQIKFNYWFSL